MSEEKRNSQKKKNNGAEVHSTNGVNKVAKTSNSAKKSTNNVNKSKPSSKKKSGKKKSKDELDTIRKSLKSSSGFMWGLLVNIVIAFLIVKLFSMSFNFAYDVFTDTAYQPANDEYVAVNIPADSTIWQIGEVLEENKIIKNKYVFVAKTKIKGYGSLLKSGKFGLSPSMKYEDIFKIICEIEEKAEDTEEQK